VEVYYGGQRVAVHSRTRGRYQVVTHAPHHQGIPLGGERSGGKILIQMRETAASVEVRSLAAYENLRTVLAVKGPLRRARPARP
jgi:hypothetical protein